MAVMSSLTTASAIAVAGLVASLATAQAPPPAAAPASDPAAVTLLRAACDFLARQQRLSFQAATSHEVLQSDGRLLEFDTKRTYDVRRPDRVWLTAERDGTRWELWFDGKAVTIVDHSEDAYATVPAPADLDGMLKLVTEELGIPLPLHALLANDPARASRLGEAVVTHCGTRLVNGVTCHHLAARLPDVDAQLWIEAGDRPVPHKVVLSYRTLPGQPTFRASITNWNFAPPPLEGLTTFSPPRDARVIDVVGLASRATVPSAKAAKP